MNVDQVVESIGKAERLSWHTTIRAKFLAKDVVNHLISAVAKAKAKLMIAEEENPAFTGGFRKKYDAACAALEKARQEYQDAQVAEDVAEKAYYRATLPSAKEFL
jgi:hypothetical protein